jgi:hypothetical protein
MAAKLLSKDEARRILSEVHDKPPQQKAKEHNPAASIMSKSMRTSHRRRHSEWS